VTQRLVDPIHFFDARGRSVLTQEHLEAQVRALTMENRRLKQLLKQTAGALKASRARPEKRK
jgi:hypothetical protein